MVGQGTSNGLAGMHLRSGNPLGLDLPPREELGANGILPQRSELYPSQSPETMLKDFLIQILPQCLTRVARQLASDDPVCSSGCIGGDVGFVRIAGGLIVSCPRDWFCKVVWNF